MTAPGLRTAAPVDDPDSPRRPGLRFADLVAPVTPDEFFDRYWETEALHTTGPRRSDFAGIVGLHQLDHLLAQLSGTGKVRLARMDGSQHTATVDAGAHALPALYRSFSAGSTIIVDGLHTFWPPVRDLCRTLLAELGMQVQANLYVTPRAAKGFGCHWDGHDALILQIEGQKLWTVYDSADLLPHPASSGAAYDTGTAPGRDITLRAGDVLYIPRGMPHRAATGAEASVHLTVGLVAATWQDLLIAGIEELVTRAPGLRASLPRGWWRTGGPDDAWRARYREFVGELGDSGVLAPGLARLASQLVESAPTVPDGHFGSLDLAAGIDLDTVVTRRPGSIVRTARSGAEARLVFPGSFVAGPVKLFWAFDFVARTETFAVRDIPGWYSDDERVVVTRALVRAGFLGIVPRARNEMGEGG